MNQVFGAAESWRTVPIPCSAQLRETSMAFAVSLPHVVEGKGKGGIVHVPFLTMVGEKDPISWVFPGVP